MGRLQTIKINKFYGGISDDVRLQSDNNFSISRNFDIFSNPTRLSPFRDTEADEVITGTSTTMATFQVKAFAPYSSAIYALGKRSSSSGNPRLLKKTDLPAVNWAIAETGTLASGNYDYASDGGFLFKIYKDYIWGAIATGGVFKYGSLASGTKTFTINSTTTLSGAPTADGHIGKDDNLYIAHGNVLARVASNHAITDNVLTLPSEMIITSLTSWGKYLAIGCKPTITVSGNSRVYLWDYVSDDITDVIDWGDGELQVLENLDEILVGISRKSATSVAIAGTTITTIRTWSGGAAQILKQIPYGALVSSSATNTIQSKAKVGSKLYFTTTDGTTFGLWSISRKNNQYPFAVTMERLIDKDNNVTRVRAFTVVTDYFYASIGTTHSIVKTDDANTHAASSSWESQKYNGDNLHIRKNLKAVSLGFPPLVTGGTLKLYYRVDAESAWTEIFSYSTANGMYHEAINEESNSNRNFKDFNEVQFKVTSTGGAECSEIKCQFEENDSPVFTNEQQ